MESQLNLLKSEFSIVKENIRKISANYILIKEKIGKLKCVYSEMISTNSHKKIFLFCLESFNFQIKSFSIDTDNIQNSLLLITNRIYCDYYKLFKLISSLFDEYKYKLPESIKERPIYNDLNPFAEYKLEDVCNLHDDVSALIFSLIMKHNSNQIKIDSYTSKSQTGICILNFIKTLEYDNSVLKDQIMLYLNYMDFFKNTQTKHLTKLLRKMEALKNEIDEEIVFDVDPDTDTNSDSSSSDGDSDQTILLTTPVSSLASSESSCVSSRDFFDYPLDRQESLETLDRQESLETSDRQETLDRRNTVSSDASSTISDAEKKNEKIEPEKKKKGRPKKEDAKDTKNEKKEKPKASKKTDVPLTENEELDFGITVDQLQEHVNITMNLA